MSPALATPFADYANNIMELRYAHVVQGRKESWEDIAERVTWHVMRAPNWPYIMPFPHDTVDAIRQMIIERKFIPGGRILSQAGRPYHQTDNCFCLRAEDSREGWAELAHKCVMMFMSGGGVGVDYSALRPYGSALQRSGGISSGPIPAIQMVDAIGAAARQGGERRGAVYASLAWDHNDIYEFIKLKNGNDSLQHTNISVRFNSEWLDFAKQDLITSLFTESKADDVFMQTLQHACQWGDPGFQFDNDNQILRNACTEIISADDCDSCCLGSINFAAINSLSELADVTNLAILFLLCNTLYTDIPYPKVADVKAKNRRIGLGIMGLAEWFIQRGIPYGLTPQFYSDKDDNYQNAGGIYNWLRTWQQNCDNAAVHWSNKLSVAKPIATRAIAPTGTISIVGGHTTPGIEPVFHTAYLRTYNTLKTAQYSDGLRQEKVIDPVVMKLHEQGYDVADIDTAYTLSQSIEGIERRIAFQAYCQQFVDNAISSTVNLPAYQPGIEDRIAPVLLRYLPQLRGITFYPDGRHTNQPVQPLDFSQVINDNTVALHATEPCKGESCGI
jgi:ribonucleoside-diphosphate reductase alpha chain